jgi:hypothetical protein
MHPRSQERHRNREATVYLPALGGAGLGLLIGSEYTNARSVVSRREPKMLRGSSGSECRGFRFLGHGVNNTAGVCGELAQLVASSVGF